MNKEEIKKIKEELKEFTGTEQYYRHYTGTRMTDGTLFLAGRCNCFWFIDIVASYQHELKDVPFQIWKLEVNKDRTAVVTMKEDSDQPVKVQQDIKYTDFPLEEYELYCIRGVILLKSEY